MRTEISSKTELDFSTNSTACKMFIVHHQNGIGVNHDAVIEREEQIIYDFFYTYALKSNKKLDEFYNEISNYHQVMKDFLNQLLISAGSDLKLKIEIGLRPYRGNRKYDTYYIDRIDSYVRSKLT